MLYCTIVHEYLYNSSYRVLHSTKVQIVTPLGPCDSEGLELMGVRGCRGLRQALGVAGVRAQDRLLQVRMIDGLQRLSAVLSTANTGRICLVSHVGAKKQKAYNMGAWTNTVCTSASMPCLLVISHAVHTSCLHAMKADRYSQHLQYHQAHAHNLLQVGTKSLISLCACTAGMLGLNVIQGTAPPASQSGSGLPATPDPAAFKDAVRNGGKLWPLLCHYLAALGQACLLRQRLASDLQTTER